MRRQTVQDAFPSVLGVLLAVLGGVEGNVVTGNLPAQVATAWKGAALPTLGVIAVAILIVSVLQGYVLGSGSRRDPRQRSRWRRIVAGVLVVVYVLLWALGGLAENVVAGSVSQSLA